MKSLITTFLLVIPIISFGQKAPTGPLPTTEEEYNYLTIGYKIQMDSGLDMKKGYIFQDMEEIKVGNYTFQFKRLIRETKKELAGILVITKSNVSGRSYYMGISINNPTLYARYYKELDLWDETLTTAYAQVLSYYLGSTASTAFELEKAAKK